MTPTGTTIKSVTELARPTTIVEVPRLSQRLGVDVFLASETFQHTGSFKFRAAYHVAARVSNPLIIAASSGNFGQAMAYSCSMLGKASIIVMPSTSAEVKVNAVREYGGRVELVDVRTKSRAERVQELAREHPEAYIASAYDDPLVIEGNSTLGIELVALNRRIDCIVAPVGGGGLTSGIITGLLQSNRVGNPIKVVGAEPAMANDGARSLKAGHLIKNEAEPQSIADGARTLSLGVHNWPILRDGLAGIIEVSEETIGEAVRQLFTFANLKSEPTGALSLGAVLTDPARFRNLAVCCVVSGGNVDPAVYRSLLNT